MCFVFFFLYFFFLIKPAQLRPVRFLLSYVVTAPVKRSERVLGKSRSITLQRLPESNSRSSVMGEATGGLNDWHQFWEPCTLWQTTHNEYNAQDSVIAYNHFFMSQLVHSWMFSVVMLLGSEGKSSSWEKYIIPSAPNVELNTQLPKKRVLAVLAWLQKLTSTFVKVV